MTHKTIGQLRAGDALAIVCGTGEKKEGFKQNSAESQKKLNSYIAGFGPMILMNGLGQACAFYLAAKEKEHQDVYKAIEKWLTKPDRPYKNKTDLMEAIVDGDAATYRLAQAEALAYLDWLKKFAKAFLKEDVKSDAEGEDHAIPNP